MQACNEVSQVMITDERLISEADDCGLSLYMCGSLSVCLCPPGDVLMPHECLSLSLTSTRPPACLLTDCIASQLQAGNLGGLVCVGGHDVCGPMQCCYQ